ncbi:hypothetical protein NEMBOFW57_001241 [Staphylotrichum longicolle]|uniref:Uncharacterized protein n=1 Tax=Staphylotrichum longicolle TaxID=669026 RepID=A0AAD4HXQ2_9PEZI|nr:hypothetical protein NEMBOFW57_001241 [Staphylotrichum longicolle]
MEAVWNEAKRQAWISSLTEVMPLAPLDHTAPQNYVMKCWGFSFPGQILHSKDGGAPRCVYKTVKACNDTPVRLDIPWSEVFVSQVLDSSEFLWTFQELSAQGVPASSMIKDTLWLIPDPIMRPSHPSYGTVFYPVTLKATFIPGGLILGFAFYHGIMDGTGTVEFAKLFNDANRKGDISNNEAVTFHKMTERFNRFAAETAKSTPVNPRSMHGYDFTIPPSQPVIPEAIAKIFSISSSRITALHSEAPTHVRATHGSGAFITPTAVLSALFWLHITRARLHARRILPSGTTRFANAVSIRNRLPAELGFTDQPYMGNMWLRALASSTVGDLVGADLSRPATTAQLAAAAWLICQSVRALSDPATMRQHIAIATRATDPADETLTWPEVDAAIRRSIARHCTGVDATVGVELGADVEFDIPGVQGGKGKAAWVRRAYVAFVGAMMVLPKVGGAKGEADWEVYIALRGEDMEVLERDGELGGWLARPAA